jgi:lactate dehydrogenase-like 2-hydroxyacid dehydrogenase
MAITDQVLIEKGLGFFKPYVSDFDLVEWSAGTIEQTLRDNPGVRAIICAGGRPLPESIVQHPHLGLVALIGAGYEGIEAERLFARGVEITNAPGANAEDVADHAVALLLGLVRRLADADRRVRAGQWVDRAMVMTTPSIRRLKVGVVGMGMIGKAIARRMTAFGSEVSWYGPGPKPDVDFPRIGSLLELAGGSDVLFLAHRANETNRGMVDAKVLEALGPKGYLVNVARGSAVDEAMLMDRLRTGTIAGAALDVFDPEPVADQRWAEIPNCLLTPHIGGLGLGAWDNIGAAVAENLRRFFSGQAVATPIPRQAEARR